MANREKYIEVLSKAVKELNKDAPIKISLKCVEDILELLKEQETIVHCKDCIHWTPTRGSVIYGTCKQQHLTDANWFCADGERNDENG